NALYTSGYKIYSTLDSGMQKAAEEAVTNGLISLQKRVKPGVEAALVAMDLRTGQIKAFVGGSNFWKNQFNRATQALRQPGSAFKPFVFIAAIENGMMSEDIVRDSPISFPGAKPGERWIPRNYDGKYYGNVTLRTALAKSLNCATIRLATDVGIDGVIEMARRLGIRSQLQRYLPLVIGASDVTLADMVYAYSAFASGQQPRIMFYERILNRDGVVVEENKPVINQVLSEDDVQEMKILLKAVVEEGTAVRAREIKRPIFGKTGTTNDYTDAWFIGFDERLVVGVWVGRDDHTPIGRKETGARAALPIWIDFMKTVLPQIPLDQNP
ncbi:MAG: penicillin-binding protein 1, partial [Nitrospirae bacterium]|nr:penicillin-binding protein 1 [Nitrospirota bacterium]